MKKLRLHIPRIAGSLLELVIGVLLLINPLKFTWDIIVAVGIFLCLKGLWSVIKYFRTAPPFAEKEQNLAKGLILLGLGLFLSLNTFWVLSTFPMLNVLYGTVLLVVGLFKVQWAADMIHQKKELWRWTALSAGVAIALPLVVLINPSQSSSIPWVLTSVCLISQAALDMIYLTLDMKKPAPQAGPEAVKETAKEDGKEEE